MSYRITCITRSNKLYAYLEHISYVGGISPGVIGEKFYITREQCADDIRFGRKSYHVQAGGYDIGVEAYSLNGKWFIRTRPDATLKDNLLSLPEC